MEDNSKASTNPSATPTSSTTITATRYRFAKSQTPFTAGVTMSLTVSAIDDVGNIAKTYTGTVTLTTSDSSITPLEYAFTSTDAGVHTFTNFMTTAAGDITFTATDGSLSTTSSTYTVYPNRVTQLTFSAQPAATSVGKSIKSGISSNSPGISITAMDAYGNVDPAYSPRPGVTITLAKNPGKSTLSGALTQSFVDGTATFSDLSLNHSGTGYQFTASTPSFKNASSLSATSSLFNINALNESFTSTVSFTTGSNSKYAVSNSSSSKIASDTLQLISSSNVDTDNSSTGFGGGTKVGLAWNSSTSVLSLDSSGTPVNNSEFDSTWTPAYSSIAGYWKFNTNWDPTIGTIGFSPVGNAAISSTYKKVGAGSASFGGSTDYAYANTKVLSTVDNWTISAWIYPMELTTTKRIAFYIGDATTDGFGIAASGSTAPTVARIAIVYGNVKWIDTNYSYALNKWNHIVAVRSSGTLTVYQNGEAITLVTPADSTSVPLSPSNYTLVGTDAKDNKMWGNVDEVAVWNTPLTATQVKLIYDRQRANYSGTYLSRVMDGRMSNPSWTSLSWLTSLPFGKELPDGGSTETNSSTTGYPDLIAPASAGTPMMNSLKALWHMNETSGSLVDKSILGQTGTMTGTVTYSSDGILGSSIKFNGTNAYWETASNIPTKTISLWINPTEYSANMGIFNLSKCGVAQEDFSAHLYVASSLQNTPPAALTNAATVGLAMSFNQNEIAVPFASLKSGWHHIVISWDGSTNIIIGIDGQYPDGYLFNNTNWTVSAKTQSASTGFDISAGNGGGGTPTPNVSEAFRLGNAKCNYDSQGSAYFKGSIDEVALWNRTLSKSEISQLYQRGASRIKFQVRHCSTSTCSDDSSHSNWKGPDGTSSTYFSEVYNTSTNAMSTTSAITVATTPPTLTFSNFVTSMFTNRYLQYRMIFETDSSSISEGPVLKSVSFAPNTTYDNSSPYVYTLNKTSYDKLSAFSTVLGTNGCSSTATFQLSTDMSKWYYYDGTQWSSASSSSQSSSASTINSAISGFSTLSGPSDLYVKLFLNSTGLTACEVKSILIQGTY